MRQVWKYRIPPQDHQTLSVPKGSQFLHFALQDDQPNLWFLVDPSTDMETRELRLAGTGQNIWEENLTYVGTAVGHMGQFVWHLFEVRP